MNTDLQTTATNLPVEPTANWGTQGTSTEDMLVPRILLMQGLSQLVTEGKASPGDIVDSLNLTVLAKKGTPVEIVPILTYKDWLRYKFVDGKWEYIERLPYAANANLPYEETVDGVKYRNDSCLNFFCVLPTHITELPFLISFKRSGYHAGRKLSTHFQVSKMRNETPAKSVFTITSKSQSVDKHTFWVLDVAKSRETKPEELSTAYAWWETLNRAEIKVKADNERDE